MLYIIFPARLDAYILQSPLPVADLRIGKVDNCLQAANFGEWRIFRSAEIHSHCVDFIAKTCFKCYSNSIHYNKK